MNRRPAEERFWEKVNKTETCWLWTAAADRLGYGRFNVNSSDQQIVLTHRWAYEALVGPIPDGLVLDHLCRNPPCCNPDHLEAVTQAENVRRSPNQIGSYTPKTHCKNGHEFTPENTLKYGKTPYRRCRKCHSERQRKYDEAARGMAGEKA